MSFNYTPVFFRTLQFAQWKSRRRFHSTTPDTGHSTAVDMDRMKTYYTRSSGHSNRLKKLSSHLANLLVMILKSHKNTEVRVIILTLERNSKVHATKSIFLNHTVEIVTALSILVSVKILFYQGLC